jgi:phage tail sheath protein FI
VNPVVTFPGEGTILYGDKTALAYSSAFDRINVRKLFLVIEKAIAKSARTALFEFNDEITRSLFKNNVNPFLRDVQSRRGMYDFLVVCDESNNPPEIIDRNEFVADIYIKPAKSINFITLNFVATKTGVNFDESVALFRGANGSTNR